MSDTVKTVFAYGAATVASIAWPWAAPLFFAGAGIVYSYLNQPEGQEGSRLGDTNFSGSSYGVPIARGWGTFPANSVYIWAPPLKETQHTEGGKGGGPEVTYYTYTASFACLLAEAPVTAIRRIWFDSTLVYNASDDTPTAKFKIDGLNIKTYLGTATQLPDPTIEAVEGAGQVPAWRGFAYFVVEDLQLESYGNRRPNVRAELVKTSTVTVPYVDTGNDFAGAPVYSAFDDTVYFSDGNAGIIRMDPVTYEYLGTAPAWTCAEAICGDFSNQFDINPVSGIIYGAIQTDLNHFWPVWRTGYGGGWSTNSGKLIDCAWGAYLDCMWQEYDGSLYYIAVTSLYGTVVCNWPHPGTCPVERILDNQTDIKFVQKDQNGYLWMIARGDVDPFHPYPDRIYIDAVAYDLNTLLGIPGPFEPTCQWDVPTQTMMICGTNGTLYRFTFNGVTLTKVSEYADFGKLLYPQCKRWNRETFIFGTSAFNYIKQLDVGSQTLIQTIGPQYHTGNQIYHEATHSIITGKNTDTYAFQLDRVPVASETLQTVVSELCADIPSHLLDVSDLTGNVRGFPITRSEQLRVSLNRLFVTHAFGAVESDGKIKFIHYPKNTVATIPESDLAAHSYGASTPDQITITREPELTFPKRVDVSYLSREREYESNSQGSSKIITQSVDVAKVEVNEVLSDDEAKQLSEIMLHAPRDERSEHKFQLSDKYLHLDPYDEVILTKGNAQYRVRINQIDWSTPGILTFRAKSTDPAVFVSTAVGAVSDFVPTTIPNIRVSQPWLLDIPLTLETQDTDTPGFTFGLSSDSTPWPGASLYRLTGTEDVQGTVMGATTTQAIAGYVTGILGDTAKPTVWDNDNTVQVSINGTLSSSTDALVVSGTINAILIGQEIIQFVTATDDGGGLYTLSRLLRGRRGTEWATGLHTPSDEVVLLNSGTVLDAQTNLSTHNAQFYYRGITFGKGITEGIGKYFTNTNQRLTPFSGIDPELSLDGTDIVLGWTRRTRVFHPLDYSSVPIGENTEAYEVDVRAVGGTTILRTISSSTPSIRYTAAQRDLDFVSSPSNIEFDIYQMSDQVGRGHALTTDLTAAGIVLPIYTDFSEYAVDAQPSDWTREHGGTFVTLTTRADAAAVGSKVLEHYFYLNPTGDATWDAAGIHRDVEILTKIKDATTTGGGVLDYYWNGICARLQPTTSKACYTCCTDNNGDGRLWHVNSTGLTWTQVGATVSLSLTNNTDTWIRFRVIGASLKAKWWQGGIGSEPGAWSIEVSDTTLGLAGKTGMFMKRISVGGGTVNLDQIAIAFNGDTASFP